MSSKDVKKNGTVGDPKKEDQNVLGPLEEDDEFEEFDVEDWEDKESDLTNIVRGKPPSAPVQPGKTAGNTLDALWEDNWDDDDVDDDFSKKLREIIAKQEDVKMKDN